MKKRDHKILNKNKKNLATRLKRKNYSEQAHTKYVGLATCRCKNGRAGPCDWLWGHRRGARW